MTDEKLRKIMGSIPTEKYYPIKRILGLGTIASLSLSIVNTIPLVDYSLILLYLLNYLGYATMNNNRGIDFTKSYLELEQDYNTFLNNYRDLMNTLDMESLASLCASFYYLMKNGYLSLGGSFSSLSDDYFEGRKYQLANIFNGCGICRHKANALKDILNTCGYPTSSIPVYTRKYEDFTREDIENIKKNLENVFRELEEDENLRKYAVEAFLNIEVITHQFEINNETNPKMQRKIEKKFGNHLIVLTSDGNKRIAYDPTDNFFYQFIDQNSIDIINEYGNRMELRFRRLFIANTPSQEKMFWKNLKLESRNLEGLREAQDDAEKRIQENLDIVEKFREENIPLMRDLRDKAYRLIV